VIRTILHISDTHGLHHHLKDLPKADVVVHSGDFTLKGTQEEVMDFANWFLDLPYKYKIFIAGNHDDILFGREFSGMDKNSYYLCNSAVEIEGVRFYGLPMFVQDELIGTSAKNIEQIPSNTDILITHQPPKDILDYADDIHYGSVKLLDKIKKISPRFCLFGHIHAAYGVKKIGNTIFANASLIDDSYHTLIHQPIVHKL
jgi:Icc-related predicted phosphoesterase